MAEQLAEPAYMANSRLWYPEGVAPFGELNLLRIDHFSQVVPNRSRRTDPVLLMRGPGLIRDSWQQSEWLESAVGSDKSDAFMEGEAYEGMKNRIENHIIDAAFSPQKKSAWFAVRPTKASVEHGAIGHLSEYIAPGQVIGFANSEFDVSGNALKRTVKRWRHPDKIYAKVGNVAVAPKEQGQNIGSALFYTSLGMFPEDKHPTTYVEMPNERVMAKLRALGYTATGSNVRSDLVQGAKVEEMRFQASSVKEVRGRLREQFPWLTDAVSLS